jgi:hypothetical protein
MLTELVSLNANASKVAASPAYLDDINVDYDKHNNIRECFFVNIENNV